MSAHGRRLSAANHSRRRFLMAGVSTAASPVLAPALILEAARACRCITHNRRPHPEAADPDRGSSNRLNGCNR